MGSKKIILSLLACFAACLSIAQQVKNVNTPDHYRAVNWGLDEGLSQGEVYSMIKDINGFLWIGTAFGLNRFDGSSFKKYFADKTKKNKTIIGNNIQGLTEDSLHNIWIGTDKGLSCYDIRADTFQNISSDLPGNSIIPFWATRNEVFCWDYPDQLAAYNIHSFAKRTLTGFTPADTVGSATSNQYAIFDAGSNSVWMEKGFRGTGGGLLQVSLTDGKREKFDWPCYRKIPNHSHFSEGMRYDRKRNSIWISSPDGLMEFTLNDKKFHHVDALNEIENLKDFNIWAGIDIDRDGRVWEGTYPKGIIIYDPANNSVELPFPNDSVQQKNVSEENVFLYCDRNGMVWSGFWAGKGIYQIIPFSPAVKRYLTDVDQARRLTKKVIINCINAHNGTLWMGSDDGINIFHPHTGLFDLLQIKDQPGGLIPINIDTMSKKAWIMGNGLFEMDIASHKCSPVIIYEDSNGKRVSLQSALAHHSENMFLIAYENGCIIAASFPGHQEVLVVRGNDRVARKILSFPDGTVDLVSISTNDDNLLFLRRPNAATNLTYARHDNNWICTPTLIDSIRWSRIFFNKADQTFWIIAETRLKHYDKNFRVIRNYTDEDGMPGVRINGLIPDNKGNIWFNTDRSIFQLNTKTGTITMLAEKDGFLPHDFTEFVTTTKDDDGDIYIPGGFRSAGFDRISPGKYVFSNSSVYFESLKINQQTFPLSAGINNVEELSLNYFENNIVIETGIIDYYSKGKGHIRYKLEAEGKEAAWQYAPAYYTIRYEELPPGKYKLILQSSNAANEFNGPEKILAINISPPFWNTWWFRTISILCAAGLLYGFIQYRSRRLRERNTLLEEKVMSRTKELKHSLEDLRETQTQLIQREKMASLGELTAGIAHEIQNPLNFVNNFSELNTELLDEMKQEIDQANMEEIKAIAENIIENEQKINHHGKRADAIVKGMLQHSRSSTGLKELTDINELTDEYLRLSFHGLRAKDKSFNSAINTDYDQSLSADNRGQSKIKVIPQDIGRVLLNLFNNAFYSVHEKKTQMGDALSPDGKVYDPTVSVSTKKIGDKVEIRVRDNGLGIPQKVLDKIYQPFFTTKPTGQGTGLGLYLSYDIITKAHGGQLKVISKEGEFAEFIIELPV